MTNIRNILFSLAFVIIFPMSNAEAGPFGLEQGTSKEELDTGREKAPFEYELKSVNKPHSEFESYQALVTPKEGLCIILALGKTYSNDRYGEKVRSSYSEIKSQLDRTYGKSKTYDFIKSDAIWHNNNDWVMSVMQNERKYLTYWNKEVGSTLKDGIDTIFLKVEALNSHESYVTLQYDFSNLSRCKKEMDQIQSGNL